MSRLFNGNSCVVRRSGIIVRAIPSVKAAIEYYNSLRTCYNKKYEYYENMSVCVSTHVVWKCNTLITNLLSSSTNHNEAILFVLRRGLLISEECAASYFMVNFYLEYFPGPNTQPKSSTAVKPQI